MIGFRGGERVKVSFVHVFLTARPDCCARVDRTCLIHSMTTQVPATAVQEAGDRSQPRVCIKVESPQFRSVHWYECVVYEDGRLPILLARYPNIG